MKAMTGIRFVVDEKGNRVAVHIDLKKARGDLGGDFWDGLVSESRRKEKSIPYEQYRASRLNAPASARRWNALLIYDIEMVRIVVAVLAGFVAIGILVVLTDQIFAVAVPGFRP